jgi:conjugal transfer pilin signal peptidase TrbI
MKFNQILISLGMVLLMAVLAVAHQYIGFGFNTSESLENRIFFLQKNKIPNRGDFVVFKKNTENILSDDTQFIKQVAGVAGDFITHQAGKVFINDHEIGEIKHRTKTGKLLWPGYVGKIPEGFYFVYTTHPRSFDSRYSQMGLIHESEIIARAYPLL